LNEVVNEALGAFSSRNIISVCRSHSINSDVVFLDSMRNFSITHSFSWTVTFADKFGYSDNLLVPILQESHYTTTSDCFPSFNNVASVSDVFCPNTESDYYESTSHLQNNYSSLVSRIELNSDSSSIQAILNSVIKIISRRVVAGFSSITGGIGLNFTFASIGKNAINDVAPGLKTFSTAGVIVKSIETQPLSIIDVFNEELVNGAKLLQSTIQSSLQNVGGVNIKTTVRGYNHPVNKGSRIFVVSMDDSYSDNFIVGISLNAKISIHSPHMCMIPIDGYASSAGGKIEQCSFPFVLTSISNEYQSVSRQYSSCVKRTPSIVRVYENSNDNTMFNNGICASKYQPFVSISVNDSSKSTESILDDLSYGYCAICANDSLLPVDRKYVQLHELSGSCGTDKTTACSLSNSFSARRLVVSVRNGVMKTLGNMSSILKNLIYVPRAEHLSISLASVRKLSDSPFEGYHHIIQDGIEVVVFSSLRNFYDESLSSVFVPVSVIIRPMPPKIFWPRTTYFAFENSRTALSGISVFDDNYPSLESQAQGILAVSIVASHGELAMSMKGEDCSTVLGCNSIIFAGNVSETNFLNLSTDVVQVRSRNLTFIGTIVDINLMLSTLEYYPDSNWNSGNSISFPDNVTVMLSDFSLNVNELKNDNISSQSLTSRQTSLVYSNILVSHMVTETIDVVVYPVIDTPQILDSHMIYSDEIRTCLEGESLVLNDLLIIDDNDIVGEQIITISIVARDANVNIVVSDGDHFLQDYFSRVNVTKDITHRRVEHGYGAYVSTMVVQGSLKDVNKLIYTKFNNHTDNGNSYDGLLYLQFSPLPYFCGTTYVRFISSFETVSDDEWYTYIDIPVNVLCTPTPPTLHIKPSKTLRSEVASNGTMYVSVNKPTQILGGFRVEDFDGDLKYRFYDPNNFEEVPVARNLSVVLKTLSNSGRFLLPILSPMDGYNSTFSERTYDNPLMDDYFMGNDYVVVSWLDPKQKVILSGSTEA